MASFNCLISVASVALETALGGGTGVRTVEIAGFPGFSVGSSEEILGIGFDPPGVSDFYGWNGMVGTFLVFETDTDGLYFAFYRAATDDFEGFADGAEQVISTFAVVSGRAENVPAGQHSSSCPPVE